VVTDATSARTARSSAGVELAYRQAVFNIDRLVPKRLREVERIAQTHPDARVQDHARGVLAYFEEERRERREAWREDDDDEFDAINETESSEYRMHLRIGSRSSASTRNSTSSKFRISRIWMRLRSDVRPHGSTGSG
jgi:hypothetical protein